MTTPLSEFIDAAVWHGSLEHANAILAAHPGIAAANIHVASILGDDDAVGRFIARDPADATAKGGPREWDALTYLCFSKYLRLDRARSDRFVRAAASLLDAGADPNTGFYDASHQPQPSFESVLYGAAGVAHHAALTRLLLERGANPEDEEAVYHSPETYDNAAMQTLVESGKLSAESLMLMLLRKHDWHDYDGVKWLLDRGLDVNGVRWRDRGPLHHALSRDNHVAIVDLLLDRGADPMSIEGGQSAAAHAARRGRGDVLEALDRRGLRVEWQGVERLIAACARNQRETARSIVVDESAMVAALLEEGADRLAQFAGNGNTDGVALLLDLGVPIDARYDHGGLYFGIPKDSMALHVAAWFARHDTVKLLIARGSAVNVRDGAGRTPLMLAVRAAVDSFWTHRRSPESVEALLSAGASLEGVDVPCGYADMDDVLRRYEKRG